MGDAEPVAATVKAIGAIDRIDPAAWDACAGTGNPFVTHAFLRALEDSGSVSAETGWAPYHVVVEDPSGGLHAAAPLYVKSHSMGEYVFDHGWADAYERAGGRYYPKLQLAVPFTPVTGPRLLARPGPHQDANRRLVLAGCIEVARQLEVSSLHITFPTEDEWSLCADAGLLQRTGEQFHWLNRGYGSFDDFLADLSSRKRKQIRRERREIADNRDIEITVLTGTDITEAHWDAFFAFYMDTGARKWGRPYLNRRFFSLLGEAMAERIALVMVARNGRPIAGALNLIGDEALYGRYWGCVEDHRFLHFEACYYRAIDFAIARGLARVEAGAQGPHKLARGYVPVHTYSAHWIRDRAFHDAVADYLRRERRHVDEEIAFLDAHAPFRKAPPEEEEGF
jgi:predicted N-acyltransferase